MSDLAALAMEHIKELGDAVDIDDIISHSQGGILQVP